MTVSVIIPTYNRASLVRYTLDSLSKARNSGQAVEIIVIDDGSTDDTVSIIARDYPEVILLKNNGKGASAARNTGLAAASGKYIMYLDSDDLAGENYFLKKTEYLEQHPEVNACYGEYDYFESDAEFANDKIIFKHKYPMITAADHTKAHLINYLSGNFLPQNSIIWRKDFLKKIKGHDSSLGINQDVDLVIRALFHGMKLVAIPDGTKVYVRHHVLDTRVGTAANAKKMQQVLELRKSIYNNLANYGYFDTDCRHALSRYLFGYWKSLRHKEPAIAAEFLEFSKKVFWPVEVKGNVGYRLLAGMLGPEKAVNLKYFLLKRD